MVFLDIPVTTLVYHNTFIVDEPLTRGNGAEQEDDLSDYVGEKRECIIVCVKAKFVDTVRARSGHPIGGFIPTWQNAK